MDEILIIPTSNIRFVDPKPDAWLVFLYTEPKPIVCVIKGVKALDGGLTQLTKKTTVRGAK